MSILDNLPLDEIIEFEVPCDEVSEQGLTAVRRWVFDKYRLSLPFDWEPAWVVKKGTYSGTFPKRVSSWLFRGHAIRMAPAEVSELGNIASSHVARRNLYRFDFVDRIDWSNGEFGDGDSCYWGDHSGAKEMLTNNDCRAVRFYKEDDKGFGRAWLARLQPYTTLTGTGELDSKAINKECFVVFNGYGFSAGALPIARILSAYLDLSYQMISLSNDDDTCGMLYINCDGVLVGPTALVDGVKSVDLGYDDVEGEPRYDWSCDNCEAQGYNDDEYYRVEDDLLCTRCYERLAGTCERCYECYYDDDLAEVITGSSGVTENWCSNCRMNYASSCDYGDHTVSDRLNFEDVAGAGPVCEACLRDAFTRCPNGVWNRDDEDCQCDECQAVVVEEPA